MDISIGVNHLPYLTRWQHNAEHLTNERTRLEFELRYIYGQLRQAENELTAFLMSSYQLDTRNIPVTIDTERGMIVIPDEEHEGQQDQPNDS